MITDIKNVIIIPSYLEQDSLPALLANLGPKLTYADAILVMDESPSEIFLKMQRSCITAMSGTKCQLIFSNNQPKSGRGASVRRGLLSAVKLFPDFQFVVECDADGSHQPEDVIKLIQSRNNADLLIGSRYMKGSKIIGWPISRVFFSLVLNFMIPKLIGVKIKDVTNGLRRYSRQAIETIVSEEPRTSGFIYLTETVVLLKNKKLSISEIPTTFVNRVIGNSTVTFNEILSATFGLILILKKDS